MASRAPSAPSIPSTRRHERRRTSASSVRLAGSSCGVSAPRLVKSGAGWSRVNGVAVLAPPCASSRSMSNVAGATGVRAGRITLGQARAARAAGQRRVRRGAWLGSRRKNGGGAGRAQGSAWKLLWVGTERGRDGAERGSGRGRDGAARRGRDGGARSGEGRDGDEGRGAPAVAPPGNSPGNLPKARGIPSRPGLNVGPVTRSPP